MGAAATVVSRVSMGVVSGSAAVDDREDVSTTRRVESDGANDSAGVKRARMPMQESFIIAFSRLKRMESLSLELDAR